MRVISGSARSIPLKAPKGFDTRPTIDKHKETLFNCLSQRLYDCVFVDLYSGSGAIGIEALSRGAKRAYFVENDRNALACIKENLQKTHLADRATVMAKDVSAALDSFTEKADIVFMDPPFKLHAEKQIIPLVAAKKLLSDEGIIVVECETDTDFSYLSDCFLEIFKEKQYKSCKHVFIRAVSKDEQSDDE